MNSHGVDMTFMGGETADVGDVVRTIAVNGTLTARWPRNEIITNEKIKAGNVIVGMASFGKATYEEVFNSGIGSNGLTSARHDVLQKTYKEKFPESFDPSLPEEVTYIGNYKLTDEIQLSYQGKLITTTIGKLLLSPTRTFAPVVSKILEAHFEQIAGIIHSSGGGQTKCMKYMPEAVAIIKDNLFAVPEIFKIIQHSSGAADKEMYQVFNMGCRLEIFTDEKTAGSIISTAETFNIDAQIIGRVEKASQKSLVIKTNAESLTYP
ncbi:MAG: hypothetical protein NVSMB67_28760 [Flavisolibacter sp.]